MRVIARTFGTLIGILSLSAHACAREPGIGGTGGSAGGSTAEGGSAGGDGGSAGGTSGGGSSGGLGGDGGAATGQGGGTVTDAGVDADSGGTDAEAQPTLRSAASISGRFFGAALNAAHLVESDYAAVASAQFSFATP